MSLGLKWATGDDAPELRIHEQEAVQERIDEILRLLREYDARALAETWKRVRLGRELRRLCNIKFGREP